MQATIELPKAFSVRDDHEFHPIRHLVGRLNPKLRVIQIGTGVHINGGCTVFWGLIYLEGKQPDQKSIETALREAGFDFVHNALTPASALWSNEPSGTDSGA